MSDVLVPGPMDEIFIGRLAANQSFMFAMPLLSLNVQTVS